VGPIAFMVNDSETAPASLVVTATSSDQSVLPDANISIQNVGGTNRSITMTSAAPGVTTVTVAVSDGTFNVDTSFRLTAYPHLGLILGDDFSYPDGSVTANSGFFWNTHSASTGATGQTQVVNGKLHLTSTQSEDISAYLTNFPYAASGGYVLYSRFVVNFSELPTAGGSGEYFAHFKEFGTSQFRARVFATTNGAAAGQLRIAIANGGFTTAVFPLDLSLNSDYVVITRYNVATGDSTLWINPSSESSTSVSATDLTTTTTIYSYAFRQNNGIGTLTVDDVAVGTAFSDVVIVTAPAPEPLLTQAVAGNLVLSWTSPLWTLQSATNISGPYSTISGASSPYTNPISGSQQFFRLVYTNAP
jgi:hypothetical protein